MGAHLRAKGKLMEVLAEKFRGLSKGLLPAAGRKGENSSQNIPQDNVQGASAFSFRGKCLSHFPAYFPPGKGTWQPGAANKVLKPCKIFG